MGATDSISVHIESPGSQLRPANRGERDNSDLRDAQAADRCASGRSTSANTPRFETDDSRTRTAMPSPEETNAPPDAREPRKTRLKAADRVHL